MPELNANGQLRLKKQFANYDDTLSSTSKPALKSVSKRVVRFAEPEVTQYIHPDFQDFLAHEDFYNYYPPHLTSSTAPAASVKLPAFSCSTTEQYPTHPYAVHVQSQTGCTHTSNQIFSSISTSAHTTSVSFSALPPISQMQPNPAVLPQEFAHAQPTTHKTWDLPLRSPATYPPENITNNAVNSSQQQLTKVVKPLLKVNKPFYEASKSRYQQEQDLLDDLSALNKVRKNMKYMPATDSRLECLVVETHITQTVHRLRY